MVRGLDLFRQRFREFEGSFVLIGGAACDEWFGSLGLAFRATRDLDIVLIIEVLVPEAVRGLRTFIAEGGYEIRQRSTGTPVLYRFAKPTKAEFPFMLELFSRRPGGLELGLDQEITPIRAGADHHSLSAILVDDDYYALIQTHQTVRDGLRVATATSLIPLKARAWIDLTRRLAEGQKIDSRDIAKHRNDAFRLAGTLPGQPGSQLPAAITDDLAAFLRSFPEDSPEWEPILTSLRNTLGGAIRPANLRTAIQTFFRLRAE
jgi:hypothetical protein